MSTFNKAGAASRELLIRLDELSSTEHKAEAINNLASSVAPFVVNWQDHKVTFNNVFCKDRACSKCTCPCWFGVHLFAEFA